MSIILRIKNSAKCRMDYISNNFRYGKIGKNSQIIKPMRIRGKRNIYIGDNVTILNSARLEAITEWNTSLTGKIIIGNYTSIEQCSHIIAADELCIGEGCVLSAFVYISDCSHGYEPGKRIMDTDLSVKKVTVGDHCFIGIGSCIMPGVSLGNNVVIGANSVVTHDIPDDCMAAGSPAKIIKKWDREIKEWVEVVG